MRLFGTLFTGVLLAALTAGAPASATPLVGNFPLDTYVGSGTPAAGPYGNVQLTQSGANVDVLVTLLSGQGFVSTGAGDALLFDLDKSSMTISGLTAGFDLVGGTPSQLTIAAGNIHTGGAGNFDFGIECHTACGSGGSSPYTGSLAFTVSNVTIADFEQNGNGNFFASDLCVGGINARGGCSGITGNVVAKTDPPGAVPEPATIAMFGAGILGLGGFSATRRRKLQTA